MTTDDTRPHRPQRCECQCSGCLAGERHAALVAAAQPILDRCLDFFGADDLDPESSEAMPVVIKNRWVYALRAALDGEGQG